VHELVDQPRILLSGAALQAARRIDTVGPHGRNRVGDVVRTEAAGKEHPSVTGHVGRPFERHGVPGSAREAPRIGHSIEHQKHIRRPVDRARRGQALHVDDRNDWNAGAGCKTGFEMSMHLHGGEPVASGCLIAGRQGWLDEHADQVDPTTNFAYHRERRRVVNPAHFAPLFGRKPRGQVMLYREALLGLGAIAQQYVSELSRRQRARLGTEILAVYALYERCGAAELLAAMELAQAQGAFGAAYLGALVSAPVSEPPPPPATWLLLSDVPSQIEIDRELSAYEAYVWAPDVQPELDHDRELVLNRKVR